MSPLELVNNLESYFRHQLPAEQSEMLVKKLARFTPVQLDALFEKSIEECKYLFARGANPVAQIYDVAKDLGFLTRPTTVSAEYTWTPTDCPHCGGCGMVAVFCELMTDGDGRVIKRLTRQFPYSSQEGEAGDYQYAHPRNIAAWPAVAVRPGQPRLYP